MKLGGVHSTPLSPQLQPGSKPQVAAPVEGAGLVRGVVQQSSWMLLGRPCLLARASDGRIQPLYPKPAGECLLDWGPGGGTLTHGTL